MKAAVIPAVGQLEIRDVPTVALQSGEVRVRLRSAALNHRDVWILTGKYAGLKYPSIVGSDGAGVVTETGPNVDPSWRGRAVVINPSFDWGETESSHGERFTILGLPQDGTFAEEVVVPSIQLTAKPEALEWDDAAALPLAGLTAYRALFSRAQLRAGERVLVNGIGSGVATFALQFAQAAGAEVWVTSSSAEKIDRARGLGASGGFIYREADWAKKAQGVAGHFSVIVDSAGGPGFESLLDLAAPGGRIVFFGATVGNPPSLPSRKVFWRQLSLLGTTMGSPRDWSEMIAFVDRHRIKPVISEVFPFNRVQAAFDLMEKGGQFGKIVLRIAES